MANVKRFRLMDEQGNVIVYDIGAGSITFDDRNMTLPQVVAMLEAAIEVAGQVKSVTLNGTKAEPDENGDVELELEVPEQVQADWEEDDPSDPAYIQHKPTVDVVLDEDSENAIANKTVTAAIAGLRQAIETVLGEGSTTAIENFQEVLDFLAGVTDEETLIGLLNTMNTAISGKVAKSDVYNWLDRTTEGKVLDARQGKALNDLIAALQSGKSDKSATVSGLSYDTTSHKLKQTVNGTASDVMTVDTAPTANSDNPVTSGGVSTALATLLSNIHIGTNGNWWVGPETDPNNDTGIKAQGPKGNSVVDGDTFDVINNLTEGGEEDALSAEMGKVLRINLVKIFNALGQYAFPDGKPELDWGSTEIHCKVNTLGIDANLTISDVEIDGVAQQDLPNNTEIVYGQSLTFKLTCSDDLHVIDDNFAVLMGGSSSGVTVSYGTGYNDVTVTIDAVTDNVVVTARELTYVQTDLVLHLDGKNRGGTSGKWQSLVNYNNNPLYFKLENCTEATDNVSFNGRDSKATAFSDSALTTPVTLLDVSALGGTIEVAYDNAALNSAGGLCVMHNGYGSGNRICFSSWHSNDDSADNNRLLICTSPVVNDYNTGVLTEKSIISAGGFFSMVLGSYKRNGDSIPGTLGHFTQTTVDGQSLLSLMWRRTAADNVQFSKGDLYSIRVYSRQLDDNQRAQNLKVDQKRFNL